MTLKSIFAKPIDRPIEGVIKADDDASLRLEIEEYVVTNEVEKRLESFLDAYNNYNGSNGVWISGFFGSGKSHLLKLLALLLENREIDGTSSLDIFLPKCAGNEILRGDLKRAVGIPSKSILFNIDQKADVISKSEIDALLAVFVKVFDEMCGYYGKQGHIAQFERDLDSRGLFESFKNSYQLVSGNTWEKGREQSLFEGARIAKAYAQVTGEDETLAHGILEKYKSQYRMSIEDFAELVLAYIETQSARLGKEDFRLNFFVDEVGQYIAGHGKFMTNLQTIAESFATKCRGRAWIIVTAQEDMTTLIGDMTKYNSNDFSKIQDRFTNRLKLTSANVDEVIQKRLLVKNDKGLALLSNIHHQQSNNFKTLFDFADGSHSYRNFKDRDHFIHSYPFIPYQFSLFQSAIQNLSLHNAFEGKHSSVGERSMLGVFQQVVIAISNQKLGQLATFDLMFEGISAALKSHIQKAIILAENQLDNKFAIRILKALFLVKYVKEFKASIRNICILMLDSFDQDILSLKQKVEEGLNVLEQQTYIRRNGEYYEYLTEEEKDIEEEIRNTEIDVADVLAQLQDIIFTHCLKQKKIRYNSSGVVGLGIDFSYSRKLDERIYGKEWELAIHIISPLHINADNEAIIRSHSLGKDELVVIMPSDNRLVDDLYKYKKTEKYISQNVTQSQQDSVSRILSDKRLQNTDRLRDIQQRIQELLSKAKFIISGTDVDVAFSDAQTRLSLGFQELVSRVYPDLRMLRAISYTEDDIIKYLKDSEGSLFVSDAAELTEPEREMLAFIDTNNRQGIRTTVKNLLKKFEHKPYGWYSAAVLCTLAHLCARGKIEVRIDGNLLENEQLEQTLRNTNAHANIILDPQVEFTASQVRKLKDFYSEFFDAPAKSTEARSLGKETKNAVYSLLEELISLHEKKSKYPFLTQLGPVIEELKSLSSKPYTWYLLDLAKEQDTLFEMKENIIDPIRRFMGGAQRGIFDSAKDFVQKQENNFSYIEGDEVSYVLNCLSDLQCLKGERVQQLKLKVEALQKKVSVKREEEKNQAKETVLALKKSLASSSEFNELSLEQKEELYYPFDEFISDIEKLEVIALIRDRSRLFEETIYPLQLSIMTNLAKQTQWSKSSTEFAKKDSVPTQYVLLRNIKPAFEKLWLADRGDVQLYVETLQKALLEEIEKGKRIKV